MATQWTKAAADTSRQLIEAAQTAQTVQTTQTVQTEQTEQDVAEETKEEDPQENEMLAALDLARDLEPMDFEEAAAGSTHGRFGVDGGGVPGVDAMHTAIIERDFNDWLATGFTPSEFNADTFNSLNQGDMVVTANIENTRLAAAAAAPATAPASPLVEMRRTRSMVQAETINNGRRCVLLSCAWVLLVACDIIRVSLVDCMHATNRQAYGTKTRASCSWHYVSRMETWVSGQSYGG
jgi:hypothetical protein